MNGTIYNEYAYATECQLATLAGLCVAKRTPLCEITRQRNIAHRMLMVCQREIGNIEWERSYPRAMELATRSNVGEAINGWIYDTMVDANRADRWLRSYRLSLNGRVVA